MSQLVRVFAPLQEKEPKSESFTVTTGRREPVALRSSFHYIHEGRARRPVTLAPESCAAKHEVKAWALPARGTEILKSLKRTPTSTPPVSESGRSRCRPLSRPADARHTRHYHCAVLLRGYRARANAKGRKATLERFPELRAFHPSKPTPAEEEYRALRRNRRISHLSAEDERSLATAAAARWLRSLGGPNCGRADAVARPC